MTQKGCAKNRTMPIPQSVEDQRQNSGVLGNAPALAGLPRLAGKLLPLDEAHELYEKVRHSAKGFVLEHLLREMNVDLRVGARDMERIPRKGPAVVVANHPYGMLDGAVLAVLLARVRPDVRVMTNFLLEGVPELGRSCIFVDPLHTAGSAERNRRALKQAVEWLEQGGMLAIFPRVRCRTGSFRRGRLPIPVEQHGGSFDSANRGGGAAGVFLRAQQPRVPVGGMIHANVRMAFLLQEFCNNRARA